MREQIRGLEEEEEEGRRWIFPPFFFFFFFFFFFWGGGCLVSVFLPPSGRDTQTVKSKKGEKTFFENERGQSYFDRTAVRAPLEPQREREGRGRRRRQ